MSFFQKVNLCIILFVRYFQRNYLAGRSSGVSV